MPRPDHSRRSHGPGNLSREVQISKALSRLLRHSAQQERIPIDNYGYVRLDHLMNWQRLKSMQPKVSVEDVLRVVEGNDKGRFALLHRAEVKEDEGSQVSVEGSRVSVEGDGGAEMSDQASLSDETVQTETQKAIAAYTSLNAPSSKPDKDLTHYFIRATQGHSIKDISPEGLLTPILLSDPASIPETVVHGTFYGAWEKVLGSGGLKAMGRNHVHFSSGPPLGQVVEEVEGRADGRNGKGLLAQLMQTSNVRSGMRPDAQILIYIDVRKALAKGMKFWRSENGVILSDGCDVVVGLDVWDTAVEVREGLGVLWRQGEGVVKELPGDLKGRGVPMGKSGRGGWKGGARGNRNGNGNGREGGGMNGNGNGKPGLRVERDDLDDF